MLEALQLRRAAGLRQGIAAATMGFSGEEERVAVSFSYRQSSLRSDVVGGSPVFYYEEGV